MCSCMYVYLHVFSHQSEAICLIFEEHWLRADDWKNVRRATCCGKSEEIFTRGQSMQDEEDISVTEVNVTRDAETDRPMWKRYLLVFSRLSKDSWTD